MQSKLSIKSLIEETLSGDFKNVHKTIVSRQIQLESDSAIKVIVAVCTFCHKNLSAPQNVNERDTIELVKYLLKFIQVPSNESYDRYIQSVYHILKLLIEKKSYECILGVEEMFVPEFVPRVLTEKHHSINQCISKSLYNLIVKVSQTKESNNCERTLHLCFLLSRLYKKLEKTLGLFESGHNCMLALVALNIPSEKLLGFYQNLISFEKIEKSLFSQFMGNFSFLYTYLLKREEYTLATNCYELTLDQLKSSSEHRLLSKILEVVEWANPGNHTVSIKTLQSAHTSLKNYYRTYNSTSALQSVCDFISSVAFATLQIYKKGGYWENRFEVHSIYYKFLNDVSLILAKSPHKCMCHKCPTKTNLNEALRVLNSIGGLARLTITNRSETPRNYKMELFRYLEKFVEHLTTLKDNNCEKWTKHWYDLGCNLYRTGVTLSEQKDTEMALLFLQKFIRTCLEIEPESVLIERTFLCSAFNVIADSYFESQDYIRCLLVSALCIIHGDYDSKHGINRWIRAKAAARENTIEVDQKLQELTLVSVVSEREEINLYLARNGIQLSSRRKIELLLYELRQYCAKWKSKIPMSSVFGELSKIADSKVCAEIFVEIWGGGDMSVHDTIPGLLHETIRKFESDGIRHRDDLLAHLYFLKHKYRVKDTIMKHCDEMERTMSIVKGNNEVVNGVPPPDPNDECDLVSSYECLQLSRYLTMMGDLDKSLALLEKVEIDDRDRLYKLLVNIAHEYSLHGQRSNALRAWKLTLRAASNPMEKLQATGFLIELVDEGAAELVEEAEKAVPRLRSEKKFEELIVYYLCKAEAYFYVDFEGAYGAFLEALKIHEEFRGSKMVEARIHLLHHKFIVLPCEFRVRGHEEYSLVKIHLASNCANAFYSEVSGATSYDMRIFFEIYETLSKMYHDLHLPREVRCYAKTAIIIAQKMVLPLRTSGLLYYLAYTDFYSCRLDDCRVKIKDFSDILCLTENKSKLNVHQKTRDKEKFKNIFENLAMEFNEMVLDLPGRSPKSTVDGSPSFAAETFRLPSFLNHEESCECFYCNCLEYHEFVLKKMHLNALLNVLESNSGIAKDFFCGCFTIYEFFKTNKKKGSKDHKLTETYCLSLLEYGNFLFRNSRLVEAKQTNQKLLDILEKFPLQVIYLYNEALAQKLNILLRSRKSEDSTKTAAPKIDDSDVIDVTPPSKSSKVTITPCYNPPESVEKIKKNVPTSLKFDLEEAPEVKKTVHLRNLTPYLNLGAKTPAPSGSKIKIYVNRSERKPKPPPLDVKENQEPKVVSTPLKTNPLDRHLASRTKLLTEKLRGSSRKESGVKLAGGHAKNVRQNLLSQLDNSESSERGDAVRRSARNKK